MNNITILQQPRTLTAALIDLGAKDVSIFAQREAAFDTMLANALHGGPAYDAAKARFEALGSTLRKEVA